MHERAPTYFLGDEFRQRLRRFTDDLIARGFDEFSEEFCQLDDYLERSRQDDKGESLRRTPKSKYLLELINFQVLDDLNREAFNAAPASLVVMPDCLSLHNPDCLKEEAEMGDECRQCTPSCQASQIIEVAGEYGVSAVFSKRKLTRQLERYREKLGDYGVIGVACINMLAEGMRSAAEADVPARGVLLNFSGCEHWQDRPCASEFSLAWLRRVLEEKHGRQD